tara:strand:- start:1034 stop:1618 length:585 start_codon:yes stop_codon:yes gene_type:complete
MSDELLEEPNIIPIGEVEGVDTSNVPTDDLSEITELGKALKNLDESIIEAEIAVSKLKQQRKTIAEEHIPELMNKHGLKLIQLDDDTKIKVSDFVDARIVNPDEAFSWLEETNNDSIIKNSITITLGRNENQVADDVVQTLKREYNIDADRKIAVHHATLKSFCRDALDNPELAETLPREAFGIYEGQRAKISK